LAEVGGYTICGPPSAIFLFQNLVIAGINAFQGPQNQGSGGSTACPPVPLAPPNQSVDANIKETQRNAPPFTGLDASRGLDKIDRWLNNVCCWTAAWNFQQGGKTQFDDFGNFNYGATGAALGIPGAVLTRAASIKKFYDYWSKKKSNPYGGNAGQKTAMIKLGIQYFQNGCAKK